MERQPFEDWIYNNPGGDIPVDDNYTPFNVAPDRYTPGATPEDERPSNVIMQEDDTSSEYIDDPFSSRAPLDVPGDNTTYYNNNYYYTDDTTNTTVVYGSDGKSVSVVGSDSKRAGTFTESKHAGTFTTSSLASDYYTTSSAPATFQDKDSNSLSWFFLVAVILIIFLIRRKGSRN